MAEADYEPARWELLKRASAAEGGIEAVLVGLAGQLSLSAAECAELGLFRQAYQQLRQRTRDEKPLPAASFWMVEYHVFYEQAAFVAAKIALASRASARALPVDVVRRQIRQMIAVGTEEWEDAVRKRAVTLNSDLLAADAEIRRALGFTADPRSERVSGEPGS